MISRHDLPPRSAVQPHGNATLLKPPVPPSAVSRSAELPHRYSILNNWRSAPKTRCLDPTVTPAFSTANPVYEKVPPYLSCRYKPTIHDSILFRKRKEKCDALPRRKCRSCASYLLEWRFKPIHWARPPEHPRDRRTALQVHPGTILKT
jgi:hypothetical protein